MAGGRAIIDSNSDFSLVAQTAAKGSLTAGHHLSRDEIVDQLDQLFRLIFLTKMAGVNPAMWLPLSARNAPLNFRIKMT